jgi:hypothetical protein
MDGIYPMSRHTGIALAVLFAAGCFSVPQAIGQAQPSENPQNNVIYGTVVNSVTHEPIGRALVYSPDNRFAAFTDGEGHFEFTLPAAAPDTGGSGGIISLESQSGPRRSINEFSWLMARKPGFLDDPHQRNQSRAIPGTELTIPLMPEGLIKGRVTLSTGDPAIGAYVQLFTTRVREGMPRWDQAGTFRTNSNGEFRFSELQPGAYKLATREFMDNDPIVTVPGGQLYGFPPVYYPNATDIDGAITIQLVAGQTFPADLSLVRQPYYDVRIPVAGQDPSLWLNITVAPQSHRGPGYSLRYNQQKQRIEGQLPNGNYLVEAMAYGPNAASGVVNIAVAGANLENSEMALTSNSGITLNVKEEFTSPDSNRQATWSDGKHSFSLHGARLDLTVGAEGAEDFASPRGGSLRPPTGPNDDAMVLENLAPGKYWLRLHASRGYVASANMDGVDLLHQPLVVMPGSNRPVDITMRDDFAEIEGTLAGISAVTTTADPFNSPPAYVYCIPLADSPGQFRDIGVSSDGTFHDQRMAPGSYRVLAFSSRQPNLAYRDPEAMRAYETKGQVVHLSPGEKATVQLPIILSSE